MLRSGRITGLTPALLLGVLAACSDSAVGPSSSADAVRFPTGVNKVEQTEEVCETIDFENYAHGTTVTNQFSVFGNVLTFSALGYNSAGGTVATPVKIYAGTHTGGPDFDLEASGLCPTCTSNMAVIQEIGTHEGGATSDNTWGGEMTISGFPANTFYIKSFQLADHEVAAPPQGEPDARLMVNGSNVAPAGQPQGVNAVITINTTSQPLINGPITFIFGNPPDQQGSEAIDNIEVCQRIPVLGDEGCTPGFWKNHEEAWAHTAYTTGQTVESVFNVPDSYGLDDVTLLEVLSMGGGGSTADVAARLLHHAVAALLNASHGLVDYAQTEASIIAETNAALASGDKATMNTLKDKFDLQNNAGCPINGKEPLPN
ncbi:MAG TPA: hypothetical protein VFZ21_09035 [Gemmatimonadaceae bacterium]|jgi:hypothetical protein|nr:hypothetical protein [Gemmatimonadaceae bacterium]